MKSILPRRMDRVIDEELPKTEDFMRVKEGFMLREIAGSWVVVPLGKRVVEFKGLMSLSESGALLWKKLESPVGEDELVSSILSEYEADEAEVREDVRQFVAALNEKGLLET